MEFKYRAVDERRSTFTPQSSNYSHFTEQARRGKGHHANIMTKTTILVPCSPSASPRMLGYPGRPGYSGPGYPVGPSHSGPGHPVRPSYSGPRYLAGPGHSGPGFGHPNEYYGNPIEIREAIWRELEKKKIREQIILEEIIRRRILDAEVRRKLMIESELGMQRGGDGFFFPSLPNAVRLEPTELPALPLPYRAEGSSLEGRMSMSLEERFGMSVILRPEFGGFDSTRFQPLRSSEPRISEVKPASEISKEREKIIFRAKPEANLCGAKRKRETLPLVDSNELPSAGAPNKKFKEEWSCALCHVSVSNQQNLNEHLQGKKHKAKEAGLRKNGKNFSIGLYPKIIAEPNKLADIANNPSPEQAINIVVESDEVGCTSLQKELNSESAQGNSVSLLPKSRQPDCFLKKHERTVQKKKKNKKRKKKFTFWCEMSKVGAKFEKVMEEHRTGKKHISMLQKANRNGGAEASAQIVSATKELNLAGEASKDGEDIVSENAKGIVGGIELEAHKKQDTYANTLPITDRCHQFFAQV